MLRVASHLGSEDRQVMACTCGVWKDTLGGNTSEVSFAWAGRREVDKFDLKPMVSCCIQKHGLVPAVRVLAGLGGWKALRPRLVQQRQQRAVAEV